MYKVNDDFMQQSKQSHTMLVKFTVLDAQNEVTTLEGVASGGVTATEGDAIRRDFNATIIASNDFTVAEADDLLQPMGTEIKPYVGFAISGEDVYVPQGVYEIESYVARDSNDGVLISVSGFDRAFTAQKPSLKPYSVKGGTNGGDAIAALVQTMTPKAAFEGSTPWTAPSLFFPADTDRWAEAQKLAVSFGDQLGYNLDGDCIMGNTEQIMAGSASWMFVEGDEECTLTDISKEIKTDHLRTGVIVIGTHSSLRTEVRGEAWDLRPNSPTYRYGPLGERPWRVYSELPQTTGQAQAMALKMLSLILQGSDSVKISCPIIPALDLGDLIDVLWPRCRIDGRYMVNAIELPFDGATMVITASRGSLVWGH